MQRLNRVNYDHPGDQQLLVDFTIFFFSRYDEDDRWLLRTIWKKIVSVSNYLYQTFTNETNDLYRIMYQCNLNFEKGKFVKSILTFSNWEFYLRNLVLVVSFYRMVSMITSGIFGIFASKIIKFPGYISLWEAQLLGLNNELAFQQIIYACFTKHTILLSKINNHHLTYVIIIPETK